MGKIKVFLAERKLGIEADNVLWDLYVDDLEYAAGILAGAEAILGEYNRDNKTTLYAGSDADVSGFKKLTDVYVQDMQRERSFLGIKKGFFGIWLKTGGMYQRSLYEFKRPIFMKGIIDISNAFDVDFMTLMSGLPFSYTGEYYTVYGYDMGAYNVAVDAPDIDDVEEEEQYDENIIEPLPRTDVILTFIGN